MDGEEHLEQSPDVGAMDGEDQMDAMEMSQADSPGRDGEIDGSMDEAGTPQDGEEMDMDGGEE